MRVSPALAAVLLLVAQGGLAAPIVDASALVLDTPAGRLVLSLAEPGGALVELALADGTRVAGEGARGVDLRFESVAFPASAWRLAASSVERRADGAAVARASWALAPGPATLLALDRTFTLRADALALVVETRLTATAPLYLTGYRLLDVALAPALADATLTAHDYNGGADWEEEFHRAANAAPPFEGRAELVHVAGRVTGHPPSAGEPGDRSPAPFSPALVATMVRRGAEASRVAVDAPHGGAPRVALVVNLSRELVTTGPAPPYALHVGDAAAQAGARGLPLRPFETVALEPTLLAAGGTDLDALAAHHTLFAREAPARFAPSVAYNTNVWDGVGDPSAGLEETVFLALYENLGTTPYSLANRSIVAREAPLAALAGVDTFVLDDGWQYLSGDWTPHPAKFPGGLDPERDLLASHGMRLGLWMSPLEFNLRSRTALEHPEWICHPTGDAFAAVPDQAGFGVWNARSSYRDHLLDEIGRMREEYGARYFKFDFATWVDCAAEPATIHEYALAFRDALAAMRARYPDVVLQMDETNDNRFFAFESAWYGPSWFLNGSPGPEATMRTLASLAPFVPLHGVGAPVLTRRALAESDALLGASSLWGHPTIWSQLSDLPPARLAAAGDWFRFYRSEAALFEGVTLPLEAPAGAVALERLSLARDRAFVAVVDADGGLPDGATVVLDARIVCDGPVLAVNPLTRAPLGELAADGDRVSLPLVAHGGAAAALLSCAGSPSLASG